MTFEQEPIEHKPMWWDAGTEYNCYGGESTVVQCLVCGNVYPNGPHI